MAIVWMNHNEMQSALRCHSIGNNTNNTETSLPLLLQSFVLDHPRLNQLVQPPAGTLRRNVRRESAESFQRRCRDRIRNMFLYRYGTTTTELRFAWIADPATGNIVALVKLEMSKSASRVDVSLLVRRYSNNNSSSNNNNNVDAVVAAARLLLIEAAAVVRRTRNKTRLRTSAEVEDEFIFVSASFARLRTQVNIRNTRHPRVYLHRRAGRWDAVKHVVLLCHLLRQKGRATVIKKNDCIEDNDNGNGNGCFVIACVIEAAAKQTGSSDSFAWQFLQDCVRVCAKNK